MNAIRNRNQPIQQLALLLRHLLETQFGHPLYGLLVLVGPYLAERDVDNDAGDVREQPAQVAHVEGGGADAGAEGADEAGKGEGDAGDVGDECCGVALLDGDLLEKG